MNTLDTLLDQLDQAELLLQSARIDLRDVMEQSEATGSLNTSQLQQAFATLTDLAVMVSFQKQTADSIEDEAVLNLLTGGNQREEA